jgi:hypothetical protein
MGTVVRGLSMLQRSQLSVQALTRLCSVYIFLLASYTDEARLAPVALQGVLLAIPYALMEALVGRPLAADRIPEGWDIESWARRAALATMGPVAAAGYLSASVALPDTGHADRLLLLLPVLAQLPLEALFWASARTRSRPQANLIPQLAAAGTIVGGAAFAIADLRIDIAALPAQLLVLGWLLFRATPANAGHVRPRVRQGFAIGSVYCVAAVVDLAYSVSLASIAGALAGQTAIVVLRALDLAFGPFHVVLGATTREDIVAGKASRWWTATRALTVAMLVAVSAAVLGSLRLRQFLADDLAALSIAVVGMYCAYKSLLMLSTWLSTRHMIRAAPSQYLVSAIGSRVVAFSAILISILWVSAVPELFLQMLLGEIAVVAWFAWRISTSNRSGEPART